MSGTLLAQVIIIVVCITGATVIAATGHAGWGWLVTIAFLTLISGECDKTKS